jgi:hypothetical protein
MVNPGRLGCGSILLVVASVAIAATAAHGQAAARRVEAATGVVTGQVSCADTNAPARFAVVTLEPVPAEKSASGKKAPSASGNATATTDLDGRFVLDKVGVGRYYVLGTLAGYLNPLARFDQEQLHMMTDEVRKELAKAVPIVDVEAGQAAAVTLRLERASEVNGTVLYDDGSPAVGLQIRLLRKNKDGRFATVNSELIEGLGMFGANARTDDHGHYRLIGAPPGEYAVRASLPAEEISVSGLLGGGGISINTRGEEGGELNVYSGDVFRERDAKTTKVGEGEQVTGVDITIPLSGLHTVRGSVTAKRDGHALNMGQVDLIYADDKEAARSAHVAEDGSFAFSYVPENKYILRVKGGSDTERIEHHEFNSNFSEDKVIRKYGEAEMALVVQGDVSGLELAAPDVAAEKIAQQ